VKLQQTMMHGKINEPAENHDTWQTAAKQVA